MNLEERIKEKAAKFEHLTESECIDIIMAARGLSLEECFDFLLIDEQALTEEERRFCEMLHKRGRAIGIKDATDRLFTHMTTKVGGQSALEYLKQFSGDFKVEVKKTLGSGGFQFSVTIPEPTQPENKSSTG